MKEAEDKLELEVGDVFQEKGKYFNQFLLTDFVRAHWSD